MLIKLRWKLTLWYIGLSVLVCVILSVAAVYIFQSELNSVIVKNLRAQSRAIRPAIDYSGIDPSLVHWAKNAEARKIQIMYTVQLYDPNEVLLEEYGPPGIHHLASGLVNGISNDQEVKLQSLCRQLSYKDQFRGYLQIQESTEYKDEAIRQLLFGLWLLAPFLLAGLGVAGYFFAGRALKPTEDTLTILRRFYADVGHELNTSITIIQATLETIEKKFTISGLSNLTQIIQHTSQRLTNLSSKLILLAKVENPNLTSPMEIVNLDEVIKSIVQLFQVAYNKAGITLSCQNLAPVRILAYQDSINTVLNNLLENALRHTKSGGTVTINLIEQNENIQLIVEDTGIGIAPENLTLIFERFYRIDKSPTANAEGLGLGLSIIKTIVESLDGNIKVESTLGKGTKFIITLPAYKAKNEEQ